MTDQELGMTGVIDCADDVGRVSSREFKGRWTPFLCRLRIL